MLSQPEQLTTSTHKPHIKNSTLQLFNEQPEIKYKRQDTIMPRYT